MSSFEYFRNDHVYITGKHAAMVDTMWQLNQIQSSLFKRLVDLYLVAAVIGLKENRKVEKDESEGQRRIDMKQLIVCLPKLELIMQTVLLLDDADKISVEDRIDRAFRGATTDAEYKLHMEIFNSYVRGGIEFLHERLVTRTLSVEDSYTDARIGNIMALLNDPSYKILED